MLDESTNIWLRGLLNRHEAVAGSVHVVRDDLLHITAAHNIPLKVQEITARIQLGKGMAGLAWERDRPIQTCNLKEDDSGAVKPGAKAVDGKAAVALPVQDVDGAVRAASASPGWTNVSRPRASWRGPKPTRPPCPPCCPSPRCPYRGPDSETTDPGRGSGFQTGGIGDHQERNRTP